MDQQLLYHLTHRAQDANKYDFGHVLILGGSPGMVGAPLLAGEAALRIGAGLVTIAADEATTQRLDRRVEEIMTLTLPSYQKSNLSIDVLLEFIKSRKVSAVVIGPGLPPAAASTVRELMGKLSDVPVVLDAGGLAAFRENLAMLQAAARHNRHIIITPHRGEYSKLTGASAADPEIIQHAIDFAQQYQLTLVLKGQHTLIVRPDGSHHRNTSGNPGLATAGTGDVLAGIIGGLLAQGTESGLAVEAGVYLHGLAGDLAVAAKTEAGIIASDVTAFLPEALKKSASNQREQTA